MKTIQIITTIMGFFMGAVFFMTAAIADRPGGYLTGGLLMLVNYLIVAFSKQD